MYVYNINNEKFLYFNHFNVIYTLKPNGLYKCVLYLNPMPYIIVYKYMFYIYVKFLGYGTVKVSSIIIYICREGYIYINKTYVYISTILEYYTKWQYSITQTDSISDYILHLDVTS